MLTFHYRGLLIHIELARISKLAWMACATIEDPSSTETSPVALPTVHETALAAAHDIAREARARIRQGLWRN